MLFSITSLLCINDSHVKQNIHTIVWLQEWFPEVGVTIQQFLEQKTAHWSRRMRILNASVATGLVTLKICIWVF